MARKVSKGRLASKFEGPQPGASISFDIRSSQLWLWLGVLAILFLLWPAISALANTFGPTGCCRYANNSTETWYDGSSGSGSTAWATYVSDSFAYDLNPTDMVVTKVSYHYKDGLAFPYADVHWYTATLAPPAVGLYNCSVVNSDNSKCDHSHLRFNYPTSTSPTARRHITCQEIGHAVGLSHSTTNDGSCMYNQASTGVAFSSHDLTHINGRY